MSKMSANKKPAIVAAAQVASVPATTSPVQASPATPKVTKAKSQRHLDYKAYCKATTLDPKATITMGPSAPKFNKDTRKRLFALHAEGQTIGQYLEALEKAGQTKANAELHLKWDAHKGFVTIA
jgi:hypothetical protein